MTEVNSYKDSGGKNTLAELVNVAIKILSLPWINQPSQSCEIKIKKQATLEHTQQRTLHKIIINCC